MKIADWETPRELFEELDQEYHFTLDAAATARSAKCAKYYTPETDGLSAPWDGETVFCHPPAEDPAAWVRKCYEEGQKPGTTVVLLAQAKTDASYFHDYIAGKAEVRFLPGRMILTDPDGNSKGRPSVGSMLVIYRGEIQKIGTNRDLVLGLLRDGDKTIRELVEELRVAGHRMEPNTVSPRIAELRNAGLVTTTGSRLCRISNKSAKAWIATEKGGIRK